jgi:hypothetical protein
LKLIIEIDLDRVHHDTVTGNVDMHQAATLVESAAARVRRLETAGLPGCSCRLRDDNDVPAGSVTVKEGDDG